MFISREDLNNSLFEEIIDAVTRKSDTRVEYGIKTAIERVKSYLAGRYDLDKLFAAEGEDRNYMVVDITANIALYIIADVLEEMPVTIQSSYDETKKLLEDLQAGKAILPGVPAPTDPETGEEDTYVKYGTITNRY